MKSIDMLKFLAPCCLLVLAVNGQSETIIGGDVGNGNFEAEAFAERTVPIADVSHWFTVGGNETATTFGTTQGTRDTPDPAGDGRSDGQAAYLFDADDSQTGDRIAANDTAYTVTGEGQSFSVKMSISQFGNKANYHGDELFKVVLFTSEAGVDAKTDVSDIDIVAEVELPIEALWTEASADDFYTTTADDAGKKLYFGLELVDPQAPEGGRAIYPRFDAVEWTVSGGGGEPE